MIKSGKVKVEKKITVQQKHYYPIQTRQWETQITEQKIVKHVMTITQDQYFCESEIIRNEPMSVTLTAFENPTIVISVERKRFLEFFPMLERDLILANPANMKFPSEEAVL